MALFTLSGYCGIVMRRYLKINKVELAKIISKHLNKAAQEGLMRTIADRYIDEGVQKGMVQGMQIGRNEGKYESNMEVAKNLLGQNIDINTISVATGLTIDEIDKLKNK